MADETPSEEGQEPGVVETEDGAQHVGVLPAGAAQADAPARETVEEKLAARTGWYRSPGGHIAHADGPDQKRAFADRGWTPISEDDAKAAIADGLDLTVDRTAGTFDADAVAAAVKNESTSKPRRPRRG